jgi:hypothetical protein
MKRALRLIPVVVVAIAAAAFGASGASGGNATVLTGTFHSNFVFLVDGADVFYTFTCNERRVQRPDLSASESANCQLDAGQTPPSTASQMDPAFLWGSDFVLVGPTPPGFAGGFVTSNFHGVVTPSGEVNVSATYAAP